MLNRYPEYAITSSTCKQWNMYIFTLTGKKHSSRKQTKIILLTGSLECSKYHKATLKSIWEGLLRYRAAIKVFEAASAITFPVSTALVNWGLLYPSIIAEGASPINLSSGMKFSFCEYCRLHLKSWLLARLKSTLYGSCRTEPDKCLEEHPKSLYYKSSVVCSVLVVTAWMSQSTKLFWKSYFLNQKVWLVLVAIFSFEGHPV